MVSLEIRRCESGDLPVVSELMKELSEVAHATVDFRLEAMERLFVEMVKAPETYLNLVAVLEGRVVGFASVIFYKTLFHEGGTALINELIVSRDLRGGGIGTALVQRAKGEAVARGMDEIEVGTERVNVAAQRFYRKRGFDEEFVLLGMEF